MDWKKRTPIEIDESVSKGDYTGGYAFLPWLWHMRKAVVFVTLFNLFAGVSLLSSWHHDRELTSLVVALFFGVVVTMVVQLAARIEWSRLKKGIAG